MSRMRFDTALVCLNGHVVNPKFHGIPGFNAGHCSDCGEETIFECPECGEEVRGGVHEVVSSRPNQPPPYCHSCGQPYPWTERKLKAVEELVEELDGLSPDERQLLAKDIRDVTVEGPRTMVAAAQLKRLLAKGRGYAAKAIVRELDEVAVEKARDILAGQL